jgi:hypothetical protein
MVDGRKDFLAPAIFTPEVVKAFHEKCQGFGQHNDGTPTPPSMGYRWGRGEPIWERGQRRAIRIEEALKIRPLLLVVGLLPAFAFADSPEHGHSSLSKANSLASRN